MKKEILKLIGVSANDYGYGVLLDATFELYTGETVVFAGLRRSGKKTLLDILQGRTEDFKGEMYLERCRVYPGSLKYFCAGKIVCIDKTEGIFGNLSVRDNALISSGKEKLFSKIRYDVRNSQTEEMLQVLDMELTGRMAGELTDFEKIKLQILKAFIGGVQIMIFRETDLCCNEEEARSLKGIIEKLNGYGIAVIIEYDSFFPIFKEVSSRVIGIRDGMTSIVLYREENKFYDEHMIWHVIQGESHNGKENVSFLNVREETEDEFLRITDQFTGREVVFERGRIIGILDEEELLCKNLEGFLKTVRDRYEICMEGSPICAGSPLNLVQQRIAVVSREYGEELVFPNLSPVENVNVFSRYLSGIGNFYNKRIAEYLFDRVTKKYKILKGCRNLRKQEDCYGLSYEQQYELMIAKWLMIAPVIVVMFLPVGNIDLENREMFMKFQKELATEGKLVVLISARRELLLPMETEIYKIENSNI